MLFWVLFFALPLAAVVFVGLVAWRLWRQAMGLAAEAGDIADRLSAASDDLGLGDDLRSGNATMRRWPA